MTIRDRRESAKTHEPGPATQAGIPGAKIRRAVFFSDVHLGWVPLAAHHEHLLRHLPALVDDAELVVLNGDVFDRYRATPSPRVRELALRFTSLVDAWRREGREVVYVEGNHDLRLDSPMPLVPTAPFFDFEGAHGERVRVLHGHHLDDGERRLGSYEGLGRHVLRWENRQYAQRPLLESAYPFSIGWLAGAIGLAEDRLWRPGFYREVAALAARAALDVVVHGHFHFGPGRVELGPVTLHKTGAWVSPGHKGTVDRVLRYRDGAFERLELVASRWRAATDGR